ncbi:MAG: phosphotransferase enzyme family protein [Tabrizicola sp.]
MTDPVSEALALWGLPAGDCTFVAGRENRVWRVRTPGGDYAMRLRRPGYRDAAELRSELDWLAALDRAGMQVPRPLPSRHGRLLERLGEGFADVLGWLPGSPLGQSRRPLELEDRTGTFRALGAEIARLHLVCDAWTPPPGFRRCRWDAEGLVGEAPVWGRFWDNPTLDTPTRALFLRLRDAARERLAGAAPDFGLIHADLVRENLLLDGATIRLIDFDDGGYGYRLFDLATVLLKSMDEPDYPALRAALIAGYQGRRPLDLSHLDLFIALRALTYVGWIVPRMAEPGGAVRNARFVAEARALCADWLQDHRVLTGGGEA